MDADKCGQILKDAIDTVQRLESLCDNITKAEGVGQKQMAAAEWLSASVRWQRQKKDSLRPLCVYVKAHPCYRETLKTLAQELNTVWTRYENVTARVQPELFV